MDAHVEIEGELISVDPAQAIHEHVYAEYWLNAVRAGSAGGTAERVAEAALRTADTAAARYRSYADRPSDK
jgi:ABC-type ATPase with predicted acetyltransferase domain